MENESLKDMWAEAKASKPKMIFLALILVAAPPIGIATQAIKLLDHPAPPISASYNDLMKQVYLSGKTTAQKQAEKNSLIGKRVEWTGTVLDVSPAGGGYAVELSDGTKRALTDLFIEGLSETEALSLSPGQTIRFEGTISRIEDGMLTGYVYLKDAEILYLRPEPGPHKRAFFSPCIKFLAFCYCAFFIGELNF